LWLLSGVAIAKNLKGVVLCFSNDLPHKPRDTSCAMWDLYH
jgi:hypothetical protein